MFIKFQLWKRLAPACAGVAVLVTALPCAASLGGAPSQFAGASAGRVHAMSAAGPAAGAFSVNVTTLPNGTVVREYTARSGVVFAVSWNGPFMPDLRTLLGPHFATLAQESARRPKAGHSQLRVAGQDVTIESSGHMRAYTGRAWIASLLPAGFSSGEIQ